MNRRELATLLSAITSDQSRIARPPRRLTINGESMACYRVEEIDGLLGRMSAWHDMLLTLMDEEPVSLEDPK